MAYVSRAIEQIPVCVLGYHHLLALIEESQGRLNLTSTQVKIMLFLQFKKALFIKKKFFNIFHLSFQPFQP